MKCFVVCVVLFAGAAIAGIQKPPFPIAAVKDQNGTDSRIIGGEFANVGQFPWQVAIYIKQGQNVAFCGGSLIYEDWVLTAAHCAPSGSTFIMILGSIDNSLENPEVTETSTEKYVHERYYQPYANHDIALIKLRKKVTLSDRIKTIPLANSKDYIGAGVKVTISGWGKTSDDTEDISRYLKYAEVTTITNGECAEVFGVGVTIKETLCAKGNPQSNPIESGCNGDSGGPLIVKNSKGEIVQAGIVTFGSSKGCAKGYPSGYARTASYRDWISEKTGIVEENESGEDENGDGGGNGGNTGNKIQNIFTLNIFFILLLKQIPF